MGHAAQLAGIAIERRLSEQALRSSEAKFRGLFESIAEGVYQSGRDGRLLSVNPAFVSILGYSTAEELYSLPSVALLYWNPADRAERHAPEHRQAAGRPAGAAPARQREHPRRGSRVRLRAGGRRIAPRHRPGGRQRLRLQQDPSRRGVPHLLLFRPAGSARTGHGFGARAGRMVLPCQRPPDGPPAGRRRGPQHAPKIAAPGNATPLRTMNRHSHRRPSASEMNPRRAIDTVCGTPPPVTAPGRLARVGVSAEPGRSVDQLTRGVEVASVAGGFGEHVNGAGPARRGRRGSPGRVRAGRRGRLGAH